MIYWFYKVSPSDIAMLKNLIEAYEGMMIVSTVDPFMAKIQITVAPDFCSECEEILKDLESNFSIEKMNEDPLTSQGNF